MAMPPGDNPSPPAESGDPSTWSTGQLLSHILDEATSRGADSVYLERGDSAFQITFQIGETAEGFVGIPRLSSGRLISGIKKRAGMDAAERRVPQTGTMQIKELNGSRVRVDVASYPAGTGEKIELHLVTLA